MDAGRTTSAKAFLKEEVVKNHGGHLARIGETLDIGSHEPLAVADDLRFCIVCFTNRCGSNFLAEVMASSGQLNLAEEVFNWDVVRAAAEERGIGSFRRYFSEIANADAKGGRFAFKAAIDHIVLLRATGILDEILERSDFVMVERSDKLLQAISLSIANQTQQWTSFLESKARAEPTYAFERITALINYLTRQMKYFDDFFSFNGVVPTSINYEQFAARPSLYADYVAEKLGLSNFAMVPERVRTQKQGGSRNDEWRARYLADAAERPPEPRHAASVGAA
jgi:trehalose 2-sulfotransferase